MDYKKIDELPKEKLLELIADFSKNWLAMDGVWFQSIEQKFGMDEAMEHDKNAWVRYTVLEAKRIKKFVGLPERAGLSGLEQALRFRMYSPLNKDTIEQEGNVLTYKVQSCRVQMARTRKGMELHPCKSVGILEYSGFARTIDERFSTECVSCYPELTDTTCACIWRFTLNES